MNVRFQASFTKDLRALKDKAHLERIKELIASVEAAQNLAEVSNVKKLHGGGGFYRVRIGDYRAGWRRAAIQALRLLGARLSDADLPNELALRRLLL